MKLVWYFVLSSFISIWITKDKCSPSIFNTAAIQGPCESFQTSIIFLGQLLIQMAPAADLLVPWLNKIVFPLCVLFTATSFLLKNTQCFLSLAKQKKIPFLLVMSLSPLVFNEIIEHLWPKVFIWANLTCEEQANGNLPWWMYGKLEKKLNTGSYQTFCVSSF